MSENQTVKDRLVAFITYLGVGQGKFEKSCGLANAYVSNIRKSISPEKLQQIAQHYPELNTGWLMTGEGEMLRYDSDRRKIQDYSENRRVAKLVPLIPIAAQGGNLNDFVVSVKESDCEKVVSPISNADLAITVFGDSMAPEYPNGAQIFITKINAAAFIEWGKVYVLDTCNGTVIKILVPSERSEYVKCLSINPDPKYAPFEVALADIYGIYKVIMCMSLK